MTKNATLKRPRRKAAPNEQLLQALRQGAEGIQRWNAAALEARKQVNLRGADLSGAELAGVDFGSLNCRGACFDGAILSGAWLLECDLRQASLKGANLKGAWSAGSKFQGTDLEKASLASCNLRGCDFRETTLAFTDLTGATLDGADLRGADLSSANLDGATLRFARYDERTRWPRGFWPQEGMIWAGSGTPTFDFDAYLKRLQEHVDVRRLGRALEMLKTDHFKLFARIDDRALVGVVKSQTDPGLVYSCRLTADGDFGCCTQDLNRCLGLDGALCKHLLVLIVGLVKGGEADPVVLDRWVRASRKQAPSLDPDVMTETLLRYKGAEAGEADWRPTETIPEDYYAL